VRRPFTLLASPTTVRIRAGTERIARHARNYDTGTVIEQDTPRRGIVAATRQDDPSNARDPLQLAVPAAATLLDRVARIAAVPAVRLLALLDDYGPQEFATAIECARERSAPAPLRTSSKRTRTFGDFRHRVSLVSQRRSRVVRSLDRPRLSD
jgi:hypothetical protein